MSKCRLGRKSSVVVHDDEQGFVQLITQIYSFIDTSSPPKTDAPYAEVVGLGECYDGCFETEAAEFSAHRYRHQNTPREFATAVAPNTTNGKS